MKAEKLPCNTCITKVMCKYKPYIKCSILSKFLSDNNYRSERDVEMFLCHIFGWTYNHTMVTIYSTYVNIRDFGSYSRIKR